MKALVTGATGLLGRALVARLAQHAQVTVLSRDPEQAASLLGSVRAQRWNAATEPAPAAALREVDVVFHLAGEPLAEGRWTTDKKRRIRESRELGTRNLVAGLAALQGARPRALISASAVGFYGDCGDRELDESAPVGQGFLPEICAVWEREAQAAAALGLRVVCVRTGVVLAAGGGALARMRPPFSLGVGGPLGSGAQWMPWVHLDDAVGLFLHAAQHESLQGPLNGVAPEPVTNATFARALGAALHRPARLPIPRAALRIVFGELSDMLFESQRVVPRVAQRTGYRFEHPQLEGALRAALDAGRASKAAGAA
jgi:uncharacterized protein (TIGR01777 family)